MNFLKKAAPRPVVDPQKPKVHLRPTRSGGSDLLPTCLLSWLSVFLFVGDTTAQNDPKTLNGHKSVVMSVAVSPDGKTLASASRDDTVRLWDLTLGLEKLSLKRHMGRHQIWSVGWSPNGTILAEGGTLWNASGGQMPIVDLSGHSGGVAKVAFSLDGKKLVTAGGEGTVKLWDIESHQILASIEVVPKQSTDTDGILSLAMSFDGEFIAASTHNGATSVWDSKTGKLHSTHTGNLVAFAPNSRTLALVRRDVGAIDVLDLDKSQTRATLKFPPTQGAGVVTFAADARLLLFTHSKLRIWNTNEELETTVSIGDGKTNWSSVALSQSGDLLATGRYRGPDGPAFVKLWDTASGNLQAKFRHVDDWVTSIAFSSDERRLAAAATTIKTWNVKTRNELATITPPMGYKDVRAVAFSPNGKMVASGGADKTVRLTDTITGKERFTLRGHRSDVSWVAFSPDERTLASSSYDGTVRLWDVDSGSCTATLDDHSGVVRSVMFSPKGDTLLSSSDDATVKLWDVGTRRCSATLVGHTGLVWSASFSADGTKLASAGREIIIWDTKTHARLETLKAHGNNFRCVVAFSPDNKLLASGGIDNSIKLWDTDSWQVKSTLTGHADRICSLAFVPDGKTLVSSSRDTTIKLWHIE